ncbi:MAG: hypothetical protein QXM86_05080 [Candidatus Bathyarchaeia archaeon]
MSIKNVVKLKTYGNVNADLVEKLLGVLIECYERLGPPATYSVNLNIFETSDGQGFFATHDASEGKPTINIYLDRVLGLPPKVVVGGVRRQAAHSILHGSPEFYKIKFPAELMQVISEYGLSENFATNILYGASMTAKEYNVTKFLVDGGFVEDQEAYVKYMLEPSAEELQAWEIAKTNPMGKIIYLVMTIRDIACAIPLIEDLRLGNEIKECMERRIKHLPVNYRLTIQRVMDEMIKKFSDDTFKNIDLITKVIVEEIIQKELEIREK